MQEVKKLYPYDDVGPNIAVQLKNKEIKLSAVSRVNGWSCDLHHQQVCIITIIQKSCFYILLCLIVAF